MNESFSAFVRVLTAVLWGPHVLLLILLAGVWFTLRGRFMQVTKLPGMTRGALCGTQRCGGFSAFQSLTASLAGSLGTGNILGVAAAILVGGAGAVVWMWIAAFFGMMTVYAEGVLAAKFGTKNAPGAIGYVQKAFGRHGAKIYAAGCVLSALGMGTMAQTGAASSVLVPMGVPRVLAGVVFAGLLLLCVRGGLPKAVRGTEKLVPFMAVIYVLLAAGVVLLNLKNIPHVFVSIFEGAFTPASVTGGTVGSFFISMKKGVSRGIFSNEAGLGTGSIAHACADTKKPVKQGFFGIFEVFIDTIVICTLTALVILCSGVPIGYGEAAGAELTILGFTSTYGSWVSIFTAVAMCCFAFSTIIGWGLYGTRCIEFLFGTKINKPFMVLYSLVAIVGATMDLGLMWNIAETFNGLMAIPNLIAVFLLSGVVVKHVKEYFAGEGKDA